MLIRLFDIVFSSFFLIVLSPILLPVMAILKCTGEGEILYLQERIGKNGKPFNVIKFATMLKNSPSLGAGDITLQNDPRVLPFGSFLRKSKINEIPQLLNILKGDMSFVGPRPQTPKNFIYFPEKDRNIILKIRPGLTGIGSIVFRDEESIIARSKKNTTELFTEDIGPYKAELEKWFYYNFSIILYFKVIFVTFFVLFFPNGKLYNFFFRDLPKKPRDLNL